MEAKDRKNIEITVLENYPGMNPELDIDWDVAEISYKAGEDKGKKQGRLVGIREVVRFIDSRYILRDIKPTTTAPETLIRGKDYMVIQPSEAWQTKLKEWGIKGVK